MVDSKRTTTMQSQNRPLGPRSIGTRSASPSTMVLPETSPLIIRKNKPKDTLSPGNSPARSSSSTPSITLKIPSSASRPATPKPSIRLAIPTSNGPTNGSQGGGDSPLFESFNRNQDTASESSILTERPAISTIRPPSTSGAHVTQKPVEPLADIREMLSELEIKTSTASPTSEANQTDEPTSGTALSATPWSDDVFEELSPLGEGAGGAVHKVRDKRTGKIMARKTITTRASPMKQLLRELSIISSTKHVNIVLFHGAYMSTSSSEVKILMEYGEGGSLESVGKQIKERGAIVGEKIAGRIAEGVSVHGHCIHNSERFQFTQRRFCKAWPIFTPRRQSIATLSLPIFCSLARVSSNCAILACPESLSTLWLARSPERVSIWLLSGFLVMNILSDRMCGRRVFLSWN
ncbi:hypothetical protein HGRIS_002517 [Hohenbuehelia grisea]|uniref:mitogen-activated protein kinase kinase n=1 Tax=Hohenbuehelia grisea TaxID=104357 RepID=A0ABR3JLM9_9AGAR